MPPTCPHATRLIQIGQGGDFSEEERETLVTHLTLPEAEACQECQSFIQDVATRESMHEALKRMGVGDWTPEQEAEIRALFGKHEGRG